MCLLIPLLRIRGAFLLLHFNLQRCLPFSTAIFRAYLLFHSSLGFLISQPNLQFSHPWNNQTACKPTPQLLLPDLRCDHQCCYGSCRKILSAPTSFLNVINTIIPASALGNDSFCTPRPRKHLKAGEKRLPGTSCWQQDLCPALGGTGTASPHNY